MPLGLRALRGGVLRAPPQPSGVPPAAAEYYMQIRIIRYMFV